MSTETTLTRQKPRAYGIALAPATPVYFGFHYSATGFGATLYAADGSWVEDRGEISTGDTLDSRATCILADAGEKVGAGSLVWLSDMQSLNVWDVEAAATYTYAVADTYLLDGACYHGGYLWWIERDPVQHGSAGSRATWFRLIRARCDLTDVTQVGTEWEMGHLAAGGMLDSVNWPSEFESLEAAVFVTANAMNLVLRWIDNVNFEVTGPVRIRMTFDGVTREAAGSQNTSYYPPWAAGARTAAGTGLIPGAGMPYYTDALGIEPVDGWPSEDPWPVTIDRGGYAPATGQAVALSGTELNRHAYPSSDATPAVQLTLAAHETWFEPILLFPME